ncbi:TetR family transcriptional regulator C-terminal domain-containing protein [Nocardia thailandica]|uniref:TetR family transcriptional regulator C-terminal domain-containing protein n=1 Tax=Nocardia thailandica TaxID=257275 RepID=A0ABW6PQ45_9NOCA|nr:TetR/AcrR family transcriptional regulator [Nocardia thailandica]
MARPRRSEDTRQALIEEGAAELLAQGYHGTGIKQVLDRVGVPKGSFYNYFDSKESFAEAVVGYHEQCVRRGMAEAFGPAPDAMAGLRAFFDRQAAEFAANGFAGGCLLANLGAEVEDSEPLRRALSAAWAAWRAGMAAQLAAAQREGSVRGDIDAGDLADLLLESWEGAVIRMKIDHSLEPLAKCLRRLLDDYFRP